MHRIETDKTARLLTLHWAGHVNPEETRGGAEEVKLLLADWPPGFRLLTDLSELETMDVACAAHVKRLMDWLNRKGIQQVVRVIPDPQKDIGFNILSLFHYRHNLPITTVATMAEARAVLAAVIGP
ncbi:MAG: hypothetical protein U1F98_16650 [Verrucomicrobiota bacterium]